MPNAVRHIHFVGIGGIGMSGLAEIAAKRGNRVSGCDSAHSSKTLDRLRSLGVEVIHGHSTNHILETTTVVHTSAVPTDHPELAAARERGIEVLHRGQFLAALMDISRGIAVAGTHGKTTTTSMIAHVLLEAGIDPTVVVGGILKRIDSNAHAGTGEWLVAEADESDRSFLHLRPEIAVITNVDAEHLDTYTDLADVTATFKTFLDRLSPDGTAVICSDDHNASTLLPLTNGTAITYGLENDAELQATNVTLLPTSSTFTVSRQGTRLGHVTLPMAGSHSVLNFLACIATCLTVGMEFEEIANVLSTFQGVGRRFELKGHFLGAEVIDDYGHHPTELEHTFRVARSRATGKLTVVFQPHRFTRTQQLWDEFVEVLATSDIDTLYIADIYPASEKPIAGIDSERLVEAIRKQTSSTEVIYLPTLELISQHVSKHLDQGDLFLTIGAGKIYEVGEKLLRGQS